MGSTNKPVKVYLKRLKRGYVVKSSDAGRAYRVFPVDSESFQSCDRALDDALRCARELCMNKRCELVVNWKRIWELDDKDKEARQGK